MRIEINAGGLGAGLAVNEFQLNMAGFISDAESVIAGFKAVQNETLGLVGGAGNLQGAVDELAEKIRQEEEKLDEAIAVQNKTNDFLELAARVDGQVADQVRRNKEAFYKKYPRLEPVTETEEESWGDKALAWLSGVGEAIAEKVEQGWNWVKDTAKKAWEGLVEFYNVHKKVIDTILIVVGAIAAIAAVVASGGGALIPLLTALGCSSGVAAVISGAVAVVAVASTVASSTLNVIDTWAEIDDPTFNAWQKGLNITSAVTNMAYSVGSLYNSFHKISPAQAKSAMQNAFSKNRGAMVDGQYVTFLSDYQPGADDLINRELLTGRTTNHFYAYDNPAGGKIYVSADPCTGSGVANVVGNSSDEFIVLSGTHGGPNGGLSFNDSYKFFTEDYNFFKNYPNVKVINIQDHIVSLDAFGMPTGFNQPYLKGLMDSGKNVICAWCYSDRSMLVKQLLGLL